MMKTPRLRMTVPILLLLLLILPPSLPPILFVTAYTIIRQRHHYYQNHHHRHHISLRCNVRPLQQHHGQRQMPSGSIRTQLCNNKDNNDFTNYDGPGSANNNNDDDDDANDEDEDVCVGGGNSDEEECEIDWSKMPGFDDSVATDNNAVLLLRAQLERQFQTPSSMSSITMETNTNEDDATPPTLFEEDMTIASQSSSSSMISDFQRLEMIWQQREESTECDIYEPITCGGQTCTTCAGTGHTTCRFCRGTKFLYLPITHDVLLHDDPDDSNKLRNNNIHRNDDFDVTQRPPKPAQPPSNNSSYISCSICHTTGTEICRTCQGSGWIAHWTQLGVRVGDILK